MTALDREELIPMCRNSCVDVFLRDGVVKPKYKFTKHNIVTVKKSQWLYF